MKKGILIIDAQNDFCSSKGSLFVPGAEEDMQRLSDWILTNKDSLDYIGCTLDSHQVNDIAHPGYWRDKDGNHPDPFTVISLADVQSGKWASSKPSWSIKYLESLDSEGKFVHVIWPEHCLIGTWGHSLDSRISDAVTAWSRGGKSIHYVAKGTNADTEHFGAFEAQVPVQKDPTSQFNLRLQQVLESLDVIYIAGEAKSHCVANTLSQLIEKAPHLASKIVVLEDTMSDVPGGPGGPGTTPTFGDIAQPIYDNAASMGVRFSTTDKEVLTGQMV